MGFENRKAGRVKAEFNFYFWADGAAHGPGTWAQALNLSESGLAFLSSKSAPKDDLLLVEFSLPGVPKSLRCFAQVVSSTQHAKGELPFETRAKFFGLEGEELIQIRRHILQVSDPKAAAASGWGRAEFPGMPALDAQYRELAAEEHKKLLETKAFFSAKEAVYLKKFQDFLLEALGARQPGNFKLIGSRALKEHATAWLQLTLPKAPFLLLGRCLWCRQEPGEKAEIGMGLEAFNKEQALRLEKGA